MSLDEISTSFLPVTKQENEHADKELASKFTELEVYINQKIPPVYARQVANGKLIEAFMWAKRGLWNSTPIETTGEVTAVYVNDAEITEEAPLESSEVLQAPDGTESDPNLTTNTSTLDTGDAGTSGESQQADGGEVKTSEDLQKV